MQSPASHLLIDHQLQKRKKCSDAHTMELSLPVNHMVWSVLTSVDVLVSHTSFIHSYCCCAVTVVACYASKNSAHSSSELQDTEAGDDNDAEAVAPGKHC